MKQLLAFIISKVFWINIIVIAVVAAIGAFVVSSFFNSYTNHNVFVEVPDFTGFHYTEIDEYINDKNLKFIISDSVFDPEKPRGVVVKQLPESGKKVKPNRKIYITINSVVPPSVTLPELKDYTVRQAVTKIPTYGLKVDSIIYRPAECDNCVIGVLYKGREIATGSRIKKGEPISIIVGEGIGNELVYIPFLYKLRFDDARDKLYQMGLNLGFIEFDSTITNNDDSANAFVYKQSPLFDTTLTVRKGQAIDLFFTLDSNKLKGLELLMPDTNIIVDDTNSLSNNNEQ